MRFLIVGAGRRCDPLQGHDVRLYCNILVNDQREHPSSTYLDQSTPFSSSVRFWVNQGIIKGASRGHAYGGTTIAFKEEFKKLDFKFHHIIDGNVVQLWLAPIDTDTTELDEMIEEYGFPPDARPCEIEELPLRAEKWATIGHVVISEVRK